MRLSRILFCCVIFIFGCKNNPYSTKTLTKPINVVNKDYSLKKPNPDSLKQKNEETNDLKTMLLDNASKIKSDSFIRSLAQQKFFNMYCKLRTGAIYKNKPDDKSETIGKLEYGERAIVYKELKNWYAINVFSKKDANQLYYIKKNYLAKDINIKLAKNDLDIVSEVHINRERIKIDPIGAIDKFLDFSLIDSSLFKYKKIKSCIFYISDTLNANSKKIRGVIKLKTKMKIVKFIDSIKPIDETDVKIFSYIGQYAFLNKYIIEGAYYEGGDYEFIDKTTGENLQVSDGFPLISPKKNYILALTENCEDLSCDFFLYTIKNGKVNEFIGTSFIKWTPAQSNDIVRNEVFWGEDNCIYAKIASPKILMSSYTGIHVDYQYLKIRIK